MFMPSRLISMRGALVALGLVAIVPATASAQGFFDFFFNGGRQQRYDERYQRDRYQDRQYDQYGNAYSDPNAPRYGEPNTPSEPSTGRVVHVVEYPSQRTATGRLQAGKEASADMASPN